MEIVNKKVIRDIRIQDQQVLEEIVWKYCTADNLIAFMKSEINQLYGSDPSKLSIYQHRKKTTQTTKQLCNNNKNTHFDILDKAQTLHLFTQFITNIYIYMKKS